MLCSGELGAASPMPALGLGPRGSLVTAVDLGLLRLKLWIQGTNRTVSS